MRDVEHEPFTWGVRQGPRPVTASRKVTVEKRREYETVICDLLKKTPQGLSRAEISTVLGKAPQNTTIWMIIERMEQKGMIEHTEHISYGKTCKTYYAKGMKPREAEAK